jgi:hypothetical protein
MLLEWTRADAATERRGQTPGQATLPTVHLSCVTPSDATNCGLSRPFDQQWSPQVWGGSLTPAGAQAQTILKSVWRTCFQQHRKRPCVILRTLLVQHKRLDLAPLGP